MAYKSSLFPSGMTVLEDNYLSNKDDFDLFIKPDNGNLWALGSNTLRTIGDNTEIWRSSPVQISPTQSWKEITGFGIAQSSVIGGCNNGGFVGAIRTDGTLWTWGNVFLGDNVSGYQGSYPPYSTAPQFLGNRLTPIQIGLRRDWDKISCGNREVIHAITQSGQLFGWGRNDIGHIGDGTTIWRSSPVQIGTDSNWKFVTHGIGRASPVMAIKTNGTLWGWGYNGAFASFGDPELISPLDVAPRSSPIQIGSDTKWKTISVGTSVAAGIKTNGTLWIWGYNRIGELGYNSVYPEGKRSTPTQIHWSGSGDNYWRDVCAAGVSDACSPTPSSDSYPYLVAVDNNGYIWASGYLRSTVGNATQYRSSPVQLTTLGNGWKKVLSNNHAYIGLKTDNTLWAWGKFGEFGGLTIEGVSFSGDGLSSPVQIFSNGKNNWRKIALSKPPSDGTTYGPSNIYAIES